MRITAAVLIIASGVAVHATDMDSSRLLGTWSVSELRPAAHTNIIAGPMLISQQQISWVTNLNRQCVASYNVASSAAAPIYPGAPLVNTNAADAYTIFKLELEQQTCDSSIACFTISFASDVMDTAHFAVFSSDRVVRGLGAIFRELPERQSAAEAVPFTTDEIAIYREFLLHYPDQTSNLIGMQDTTVPFIAPLAFGYESDPPDVITPSHSGRKLPADIMALADEGAVTARIAAAGKLLDARKLDAAQGPDGYVRTHLTLSEIAFDSKRELAVLVFTAQCRGKCGGRGTVV